MIFSCDSIEKLKKKCESNAMEKELKEPPKFKDFYQFTFNFAKNPGQKGLGEFFSLLYSFKKKFFSPVRFGHGFGILEHRNEGEVQISGSLVSISSGWLTEFILWGC